MHNFLRDFVVAAIIALLFAGCNATERAKLTESDNVRFLKQLVSARNAVWATPLETDTDVLGAVTKLVELKDANGESVDVTLRGLRDTLVRISDRKLEISRQLNATNKDIDDFNASGVVEKLVSRSRVHAKAEESFRLVEELEESRKTLQQWDTDVEATWKRLNP